MTTAVCYHCGALKFGAFTPCPGCSTTPATEDALALSLAMTDHYFDNPTLEQMSTNIRAGKPVVLDPGTREDLVTQLRAMGLLDTLRQLNEGGATAVDPFETPPE